jgi:hypothetical protein
MTDPEIIEFLDWIVEMDLDHYSSGEDESFGSFWYLKRSLDRFSSQDLMEIYTGTSDKNLRDRWNWAVARSRR